LISDYDAVGSVAGGGKPATGAKMDIREADLMAFAAGMDMYMLAPKGE
jgi:hypothetical protein